MGVGENVEILKNYGEKRASGIDSWEKSGSIYLSNVSGSWRLFISKIKEIK